MVVLPSSFQWWGCKFTSRTGSGFGGSEADGGARQIVVDWASSEVDHRTNLCESNSSQDEEESEGRRHGLDADLSLSGGDRQCHSDHRECSGANGVERSDTRNLADSECKTSAVQIASPTQEVDREAREERREHDGSNQGGEAMGHAENQKDAYDGFRDGKDASERYFESHRQHFVSAHRTKDPVVVVQLGNAGEQENKSDDRRSGGADQVHASSVPLG